MRLWRRANDNQMKISCVLDSLGGGGAERVMIILAGGLADRGHDMTITTIDAAIPDFYAIDPRVKRVRVPLAPGVCRWFDIARQIRRVRALQSCVREQKPDLIISFVDTTNILALLAFPSGTPPVISCEHINPVYHPIGAHWRILRRLLYPRAARVVMLTEDTLAWARSLTPAWNVVAIANPVSAPVFSGNPARPDYFGKQKNILAMGRLAPQKGFDILMAAFAGIAKTFPEWRLTILGEGAERGRLEALRNTLGLTDRVSLPGTCRAAYDVLKHADLFVMSSRYEGFPMALAEALACGVPAVSFDCPSGPRFIIRHGVDGLLVPPENERKLSEALAELMADGEKRKGLADRAPEVIRRFSVEKYLDAWAKLVLDTTGSP